MLLPDKDIISLSIVYRKSSMWRTEQAAVFGLSSAQVPIVLMTCSKPGVSQNEIVKSLALEKSVVAKSIGKLMDMGYLTREQNQTDKRAFQLYPTEKALEAYPALVEHGKKCIALLTEGLTDDERAMLSLLLEKMVRNALERLCIGDGLGNYRC